MNENKTIVIRLSAESDVALRNQTRRRGDLKLKLISIIKWAMENPEKLMLVNSSSVLGKDSAESGQVFVSSVCLEASVMKSFKKDIQTLAEYGRSSHRRGYSWSMNETINRAILAYKLPSIVDTSIDKELP